MVSLWSGLSSGSKSSCLASYCKRQVRGRWRGDGQLARALPGDRIAATRYRQCRAHSDRPSKHLITNRGTKIDNLVERLRFHAGKQLIKRVSRLQNRLDDEPTAFFANFDLLTDIQRSCHHEPGGDADCRTIAPFFHQDTHERLHSATSRSEEHTSELQS